MFLGIDGGTEAIKAGVFDADGTLLASAERSYPTHFPRPGHAEQNPADWWDGLVGAARDCLESISPEAIQGIGFDATTCTLLPVAADGQPTRQALLWMDVRASEQATRIFETGHPALRYSLAGVSAEWMPPKALWLKEHEPQIYNDAAYLIEFTDWIAYRLTGRLALNINTTTQRWFYDVSRGGWPSDFFEQIGLGGIEEKFPPDVLRLGEIVGELSRSAAEELGLPAGIPVAMGGGDAFVALLGLGVVNPGDLGVVMGSSNVLAGLSKQEFHVPGILGTFPDAAIPGLQLVEGGQVSTGSILNWFKRNFAGELESLAAQQNASIYQLLDHEAAQVPVGSDGLIVLDYFQGNRTPHTDSYARGAVIGLSLHSSRAHVFRALMEGVAYGMRDILETFEANDFAVTRMISCGGATKSPTFMQIYADVAGKPLYVAREQEASLLGSAVLAAVGSGSFESLESASGAMTAVAKVYEPDAARHQAYQFYFEKYREAYQQLRDMMSEITRKQINEHDRSDRH